MKPLAIDLFTGLHGWSEGLVAEGYRVIGFDIEDMCAQFGQPRPEHVQLVIQDVLTLHGSQFKDAALIVASPPCQEYSYMAMPWKLAKAKAKAIRDDATGQKLADLNRLFNACFRLQKEASAAAGRHIPLVVENVRGAQPWVGRANWNYGSFYLWGDIPALMPMTVKAQKFNPDGTAHPSGSWFAIADSKNRGARSEGTKNNGRSWFAVAHNKSSGVGRNPVSYPGGYRPDDEGIKRPDGGSGSWFGSYAEQKERGSISPGRMHGSKSNGRKMASAMIAKIPLPLSRYIAATYRP